MEHTLQLGEILKDGMYPVESEGGDNWRILHGDTLKLVKAFQPGTFDAVITDPPYASGGTKQNERNRTTNQKYSSMSPEKALPDLLWSSIFVTLMANKIGGLQFGIYRNCQISSRVFHTAVAALPLTKANRSDFE